MLVQPTPDRPGVFIDKLRVEAVVPIPSGYRVALASSGAVIVTPEVGSALLAELAAK